MIRMNKRQRCESELYWNRGFSRLEKERYKCKKCNYTYTIGRIWKYSDAQKKEALRYHNEMISFRVIERLPHIGHNSVIRWVSADFLNVFSRLSTTFLQPE
ncbi:MAG: hypothetical protein LBP36_03550 [Oscillospiraceae bacterium]|nr:hypothetical protein [Oscillospiraceae bacterium]